MSTPTPTPTQTPTPTPTPTPVIGGLVKEPKPKRYPKGVLGTIQKMADYLNRHVANINGSKIFAGIIIIILNIASKYVNMNLSKTVEGYLKFSFSRNILVFAATWMGTRDIYVALAMTTIFIVVVDVLMNEESDYCMLPESFVDYHVDKVTTPDVENVSKLTDADVKNLQNILDKLKK